MQDVRAYVRACKACVQGLQTHINKSYRLPKNVLDLGRLAAQFLKYLGRIEAFRQKTNAFHPTAWPMGGFKTQGCGYPGILASFVTYKPIPLNFPREGGQIAKKWSENDPLVVGGVGEEEAN